MGFLEIAGTVVLDIFVPKQTRKKKLEDFIMKIKEKGGKVEITNNISAKRVRVHNNKKIIAHSVLESALRWAEENLYDHAYR